MNVVESMGVSEIPEHLGIPRKDVLFPEILENAAPFVTWNFWN